MVLQAIDSRATASTLLGKDGAPVSVEVGGCGPVVVNAGQTGYFRTQYADADLTRIRQSLGQIAEVDRLGLLNDIAARIDALVPVQTHPSQVLENPGL